MLKSSDSSGELVYTRQTGGGPIQSVPVTYSVYETINYSTGRNQFNSCYHEKFSDSRTIIGHNIATFKGKYANQRWNWFWNGYEAKLTEPAIRALLPLGFVGRSIKEMSPSFKADFSLPNFILELGDIRRTVFGLLDAVKSFMKRSDYDAFDLAADANLWYNFGAAPFVNDIKKLSRSYSDFKSDYNKFKGQSGTKQVRHYREEVEVPSWTFYSQAQSNMKTAKRGGFTMPVYATMSYTYSILVPSPPPNFGTYLKHQGVRPSNIAATVWNAIPFSFCVDWLVKMGDWFESLDKGAIPVKLTILGYCYSQKVEYVVSRKCDGEGGNQAPNWISGSGSWGTFRHKVYLREVIDPLTVERSPALPKIDGLSIRELGLGGSLIKRKL